MNLRDGCSKFNNKVRLLYRSQKHSCWWKLHASCIFLILTVLLLTALLLTLVGDDIRTIYWVKQTGCFLYLNEMFRSMPPIFWMNLTELGDAIVLFPFTFGLITRFPVSFFALWTSVPIAATFSVLFKHLSLVPRPAQVLNIEDFNIIGAVLKASTSFPSGHTITIFTAVVAVLASLYPSPSLNRHGRIICVGFLFAAIVGVSRIAVGAHWPLDIFSGAIFGTLAGLIGARYSIRSTWWKNLLNPNCAYFISLGMLAWSLAVLVKTIENTEISVVCILSSSSGILAAFKYLYDKSIHLKHEAPLV
ncbi:hypothetical protein TDB9533_00540 [Thalassocella blandensis]|nr:hypothetical protein TDB9533_00540 [Thalassocella blandensis]